MTKERYIASGPVWEVEHPSDYAASFRALAGVLPEDAVLHLDGPYCADVFDLLDVPEKERPGRGGCLSLLCFWTWRGMGVYPISASKVNLQALAELAERHAAPEICMHLFVTVHDEVILHWYDWPCDPLYVSLEFEEAQVARFCEELGCGYRHGEWKMC